MKQSTFFSIIPSGILTNETISDASKITYALILGLSNQYGYCFATNQALAEMRRTSESSIKRHIKELLEGKCLNAEYNHRNDRRLTPIIMATSREKVLRNQSIVQFTHVEDDIANALDQVWKAIK